MVNLKGFKLHLLLYIIISLIIHISFISIICGFQNPFFIANSSGVILVSIESSKSQLPDVSKGFSKEKFDLKTNMKQEIKGPEDVERYSDMGIYNKNIVQNSDSYSSESRDTVVSEFYKDISNIVDIKENSKEIQLLKHIKEKYFYDIYWLGIYAGNATLEANNDNGLIRITTRVQSAPLISTFYKVEDFAESIVSDGLPVNLRIKQREGRYTSDKETIFDIPNNKITFYNYKKGSKTEHDITDKDVWDVLSGFFYLRTKQIELGFPIYINIFDSNKFIKTTVHVLRKETINVIPLGEIQAIIIRPEIHTEGLFKKSGDIYIWLTDDEERIPVRVETKVPVGNVVAELKKIEIK
jgi:hypothetical protein